MDYAQIAVTRNNMLAGLFSHMTINQQEQTDQATTHNAHLPLSQIPSGTLVELVEIESCPRMRKRLADLGLNVGTTVRVIQGGGGGPMILAVRGDTRMGIGRRVAQKIIVQHYRI
jgi:Fe2+ transport system protein FeoA